MAEPAGNRIATAIKGALGDVRGSAAIEYAVMASLIAVAIITVVMTLGKDVAGLFQTVEAIFHTV
jgi:pilus assembly protein Flp/PilA